MLPIPLRILLVAGALFALWVVASRVKKAKILVEDSIFWIVLALVLVLFAAFPDAVQELAWSLGFMSASNFVFLGIIVLLLWKLFTNSSEISRLKNKVNELAQEIALERSDASRHEGDQGR